MGIDDKCRHGNVPADCDECNPILKGVNKPGWKEGIQRAAEDEEKKRDED